MAIPTESFNVNKALGYGRFGDANPISNVRSYAAEEDDIEFGHAVMDGTDAEKQVKLFAAASGVFRGVAGFSVDASNIDNSLFDDGDSVPVIDQGIVTVTCEQAVNVGDAVRVRHDATGAGHFRTTADPGKSVLLTGAEWREDGASGTAVKLFLNPPFTETQD